MQDESVNATPEWPQYFAKTFAGFEELLVPELEELGGQDVTSGRRGVQFGADMATLMRVCIASRFALRVLRPIFEFEARTPDDIYEYALHWDWDSVMSKTNTFSIDFTVHSEVFTHSQFAMLRLKDAIVDYFRAKGGLRPSVNRERPDVRVHLHISGRNVTVSLDAAGEALSRRGYRPSGAIAPLNEVLAAGLLAKSGWKPGIPLYDPMCGSGTFVTEAAMWADGLPVNWHRRKFAFMQWRGYDEEVFYAVRDELLAARKRVPTEIFASDKDFKAISQTRTALMNMEIDDAVELGRSDFFKLEPRTETGMLVMNPPYGERMEHADGFYTAIGDRLKHHWPGFKAWIITSDFEAMKHIGLRPFSRKVAFNGSLECRWLGFDLFEGKKGHGAD